MDEKFIARFWSKVNKDGPVHPTLGTKCWEWTASKTNGYGQSWNPTGGSKRAHRIAWHIVNGAPPAKFLLHRCDNPACVRPEHMFEGEQRHNIWDMMDKGRMRMPNRVGENQNTAKLTENDVREIRRLCNSGMYQRDVAPLFGVKKSAIGEIMRGRNWGHVK